MSYLTLFSTRLHNSQVDPVNLEYDSFIYFREDVFPSDCLMVELCSQWHSKCISTVTSSMTLIYTIIIKHMPLTDRNLHLNAEKLLKWTVNSIHYHLNEFIECRYDLIAMSLLAQSFSMDWMAITPCTLPIIFIKFRYANGFRFTVYVEKLHLIKRCSIRFIYAEWLKWQGYISR